MYCPNKGGCDYPSHHDAKALKIRKGQVIIIIKCSKMHVMRRISVSVSKLGKRGKMSKVPEQL